MRQRLLTSWGTGNREGEETEWPEIIYSLQRHTPSHPLASGRPHLLKVLPPPRIGPPNTVLGAWGPSPQHTSLCNMLYTNHNIRYRVSLLLSKNCYWKKGSVIQDYHLCSGTSTVNFSFQICSSRGTWLRHQTSFGIYFHPLILESWTTSSRARMACGPLWVHLWRTEEIGTKGNTSRKGNFKYHVEELSFCVFFESQRSWYLRKIIQNSIS
jgi:hypothetical protein